MKIFYTATAILTCVLFAIGTNFSYAQCDSSILLSSGIAYCSGDTLRLSTPIVPQKITWYRNGIVVDTARSTLSTSSVVFAGTYDASAALTDMNEPFSIARDRAGYIYVSDSRNNRVIKFPPNSTQGTAGVVVAGGTVGSALNQLNYPAGIFIDKNDYLYVADEYNNRVLRFPPNATTDSLGTIVAGGNGAGNALNQIDPIGIFVDSAGYIFIADYNGARVLKFAPGSTQSSNGAVAAQSGLGNPMDVFIDKAGYLYVSEGGQMDKVTKFAPNSNGSTGGTIVAGSNSFFGFYFDSPWGIYVADSGDLYVADANNSQILKFYPGQPAGTNGQSVSSGHAYPTDVMFDAGGSMYICDLSAQVIVKYPRLIKNYYATQGTGTYTAVATYANGCSINSNAVVLNAPATAALSVAALQNNVCYGTPVSFAASLSPSAASVKYQWKVNGLNAGTDTAVFITSTLNNNDSVWCVATVTGACVTSNVVTSNKVKMIISLPTAVTISTTKTTICEGEPVTFTATAQNTGATPVYTWYKNSAVVSSAAGTYTATNVADMDTFWVSLQSSATCLVPADTFSNRILIGVNPVPQLSLSTLGNRCSDTLALTGAAWMKEIVWQYNGNNVDTVYNRPHSNVLTPGVVVAGGNGQGFNNNQFYSPFKITFDKDDNFYVTDRRRVLKFGPRSTRATYGHTFVIDTAVGPYPAQLLFTRGGAFDTAGNYYVCDQNNDYVLKFPPNSGPTTKAEIIVDGSIYNVPLQQWVYQLDNPNDICLDKQGNMYVSDQGGKRIMKFPPNSTASTYGTVFAGGNGTGSALNQFRDNMAVTIDNVGNIYVADETNHRILRFPPNSTKDTLGTIVAGGNGQGSALNQTSSVWGIYVDTSGIYAGNSVSCGVGKFPLNGSQASVSTTIAGYTCGNDSIRFGFVTGLAFDSKNNLYVVDINNYRILKFYTEIDTLYPHAAAGNWQAIATTQEGCRAVSNTFNLNLTPLTPSITIGANTPDTICNGTPVTFTATGLNGGAGAAYTWYKNGSQVGTGPVYADNLITDKDSVWATMISSLPCAQPKTVTSNKIKFTVDTIPTVVVLVNPSKTVVCSNELVTFNLSVFNEGNNPLFQWYKNGVAVGTNSIVYTDSVFTDNDSIWATLISNMGCAVQLPVTSNVVTMQVTPPLAPSVVIISPYTSSCAGSGHVFIASPGNGGNSPSYQWFKNGSPVGADADMYTDSVFANGDSVWVILTSNQLCASPLNATSNSVKVFVKDMPEQQLCLVTTDTALNKNIVVWQKNDKPSIDSYFVYRAIVPGGSYGLIAGLNRDSLSAWADISSAPDSTAYRYKIQAKDTCGNTSVLSNYHQTIYLHYSGANRFDWTAYEIENTASPVTVYNLYRDDNATGNWQLINTMSGAQLFATDTDYQLYPAARYKIVVQISNSCQPERSIDVIESNIVSKTVTTVMLTTPNSVKLYPNPNEGNMIIETVGAAGAQYFIYDLPGNLIAQDFINSNKQLIHLPGIANGVYLLNIKSKNNSNITRFTIAR